jgi:hypothetical protein
MRAGGDRSSHFTFPEIQSGRNRYFCITAFANLLVLALENVIRSQEIACILGRSMVVRAMYEKHLWDSIGSLREIKRA